MAIIKSKPTSAGRRFYTKLSADESQSLNLKNLSLSLRRSTQERTVRAESPFVTRAVETDKNIA